MRLLLKHSYAEREREREQKLVASSFGNYFLSKGIYFGFFLNNFSFSLNSLSFSEESG